MMKTYLLDIYFFLLTINCFAQSDSEEVKHRHRVWMNPSQIVTGQYTIAYAWNIIHHGKDWYELAAGYRYFPFRSLEHYYAPGGTFATPSLGLMFYGPSISFSYDRYYVKVKPAMRKAAERTPAIQDTINNLKPLNSVRYELQYQYLQHEPYCYYRGEEDYAYTYSSYKHCVTGKILWSRILSATDKHAITEFYGGLGFQVAFGKKTQYIDTAFHPGPGYYDLCVHDMNASSVVPSIKSFGYFIPFPCIGVRIGFQ